MACPVCGGTRLIQAGKCDRGTLEVLGTRPCPRCCPHAPGRMLKAIPDESKGAAEMAAELSEELKP